MLMGADWFELAASLCSFGKTQCKPAALHEWNGQSDRLTLIIDFELSKFDREMCSQQNLQHPYSEECHAGTCEIKA